jgi:peptidyl-prolyl cis-trans isomerase SurA
MTMITLPILAGLAWAMALAPVRAAVVDRIVAQVNDEIITQSEVEAMAKYIEPEKGSGQSKGAKQMQRELLEALIDRKLALSEAKRRGISGTDKELDQALQEFRRRNNIADDAALDKVLSQSGLTYKDLRDQIQGQLIQERLASVVVGGKVTVNDAEVRRFYDEQTKGGGGEREQVHLRMIVLDFPANPTPAQKEGIQKKTETIIKEIRQAGPKSFPEVARKHEVEVVDLGAMVESDMAPPLAEAVKRGKPGDIFPIETPKGFQLIQMTERRIGKAKAIPFEEAAPRIRQILMTRNMEKLFIEWVKTLRDKAVIKIMM